MIGLAPSKDTVVKVHKAKATQLVIHTLSRVQNSTCLLQRHGSCVNMEMSTRVAFTQVPVDQLMLPQLVIHHAMSMIEARA